MFILFGMLACIVSWLDFSSLIARNIKLLFSPMIMQFQFSLLKNTSAPDYNHNLSPLQHARLEQQPRNFVLIGIVTVHLLSLICIAIIVKFQISKLYLSLVKDNSDNMICTRWYGPYVITQNLDCILYKTLLKLINSYH